MLKSGPLKITLIYVIISLLWIFGSDHVLGLFKSDIDILTYATIVNCKRFFFVFATGAMLFVLIRDSTREIAKHKNEYREIYDANPSPMWIYDPLTLKFVSVNDTALSVYGYTREEFLNMHIQDIRPADDHERLTQAINRDGKFQKSGVWRHMKKDGTELFVDVSSHKVKFRDKDAVIVLSRDYTQTMAQQEQLKQANLELTNEKTRLGDIQELSKIAGWDFYVDDRKLTMSDEMYKIFGLNRQFIDIDYHLFFKVIHRDDLHNFISAITITMDKGIDLDIVHRFFLGKGNIRYIRELGKMEYLDGKPYKIRGIMQDITELKLMEMQHDLITDENRKLDNIITKINNMVILLDTESRITWVNKAYENFSGYVLDEVVGHRPSEFMTDLTDQVKLAQIDQSQEKLEVFSVDVVLFTKTKESYWVNIEFTPMFDKEKYIGYITVHNNITARKEKEKEITKQNTILRNIAWLSSHEIRRPAASILALIDLIKTANNAKEKDELLTLLNESTQQLDRIIHLINITIYNELPDVDRES